MANNNINNNNIILKTIELTVKYDEHNNVTIHHHDYAPFQRLPHDYVSKFALIIFHSFKDRVDDIVNTFVNHRIIASKLITTILIDNSLSWIKNIYICGTGKHDNNLDKFFQITDNKPNEPITISELVTPSIITVSASNSAIFKETYKNFNIQHLPCERLLNSPGAKQYYIMKEYVTKGAKSKQK